MDHGRKIDDIVSCVPREGGTKTDESSLTKREDNRRRRPLNESDEEGCSNFYNYSKVSLFERECIFLSLHKLLLVILYFRGNEGRIDFSKIIEEFSRIIHHSMYHHRIILEKKKKENLNYSKFSIRRIRRN